MRPFQFYFVSTPIGNLEDISGRAVGILGSVDFLLAEDTRKTRVLLARYGIDVPVRPYHDHNKEKATPSIVDSLKEGATGALVSDAGTPCISDPGFYLARKLIEEQITFTSLPGPSAVTTALVLSGLPPTGSPSSDIFRERRGRSKRCCSRPALSPARRSFSRARTGS